MSAIKEKKVLTDGQKKRVENLVKSGFLNKEKNRLTITDKFFKSKDALIKIGILEDSVMPPS